MKLFLLLIVFSVSAFADDLNPQLRRVMACQTPDTKLYLEVFHDQAGMLGAPKDPIGYLVIWATTMGKDTQKSLILDVPMKHKMDGANCLLDINWSLKKYDGTNAVAHYNALIAGCSLGNKAPKGKLTQKDIYPNGKEVLAGAELNCQLQ